MRRPESQLMGRKGAWLVHAFLLTALLSLPITRALAQQPDPATGTNATYRAAAPHSHDSEVARWYIKGGPVIPVNEEFSLGRISTGWTVQSGIILPISSDEVFNAFFDLGAGYASNCGGNGPVTTSGTFYAPYDDHDHRLDNFYQTTLHHLHRASVHAALGGSYFPLALNSWENQALSFNLRLGPRAGYYDADITHEPTDILRLTMAAHVAHGHDPRLFQFTSDVSSSGLFLGFFGSVGAGLTWYDLDLLGFSFSAVTLGIEVEFAHDWFDLNLDRNNRGLTTITPMATLGFSF